MVTHISRSQSVQTSGTSSNVLSEVLKLPEPQSPKRKAGFNTGKAVSITEFVSDLKDKEKLKKRKRPNKLRYRGKRGAREES